MRRASRMLGYLSVLGVSLGFAVSAHAAPDYRIAVVGPSGNFWTQANLDLVMSHPRLDASITSLTGDELKTTASLANYNVLVVAGVDRAWATTDARANVASFVRRGGLLILAPVAKGAPSSEPLVEALGLQLGWASRTQTSCPQNEKEVFSFPSTAHRLVTKPNSLSNDRDLAHGIAASWCEDSMIDLTSSSGFTSIAHAHFEDNGNRVREWELLALATVDGGAVVASAARFGTTTDNGSPNAHHRLAENLIRYVDVLRPQDTTKPDASIHLLPEITNKRRILVSGTAVDASGIATTELLVNGLAQVHPSLNDDGEWAEWVTLDVGPNTIQFHAVDNAGNRASTEIHHVELDRDAPTIHFDVLPEITRESQATIQFTVTKEDETRVTGVELLVNGAEASTQPLTAGTNRVVVTLREGKNYVRVVARDSAGNRGQAVARIILDTIHPTLCVAELPAYTNLGSVEIAGTAADRYGIARVHIRRGAEEFPVTVDAAGAYREQVTLVEGENTILVIAEDRAGNKTILKRGIVFDETKPQVRVLTPGDGDAIGEAAATLEVEVIDATPTVLLANGKECGLGLERNLYVCPVAFDEEGYHSIDLVATDAAGNSSDPLTHSLFVVLSAPALDMSIVRRDGTDGRPRTLGLLAEDELLVTLRVDALAATHGRLTVGPHGGTVSCAGQLPDGAFETPRFGDTLTCSVRLEEGVNHLVASVTDEVGRTARTHWRVLYDKTAPEGFFVLPAYGRGTIRVAVHAWDELTGVQSVQIEMDGVELTPVSKGEGGVWFVEIDTTDVDDGPHEFHALLTDRVGNSGSPEDGRLVVDNHDPVIQLHPPSGEYVAGEYVAGTIEIRASAMDETSGVAGIKILVGGKKEAICLDAEACETAFDTESLPKDGPFVVRVVAWDRAGNSTFVEETLIAANSRPEGFLISPVDNSTLKGASAVVRVNVDDPYFSSVTCEVDGIVLGTSTEPMAEWLLNLDEMLDGVSVVRCEATNLAGLSKFEEARVTIRNWTIDVSPSSLNLSSKGGANSVTVTIEGPSVKLLTGRPVELYFGEERLVAAEDHPGAGTAKGKGKPSMMLKFDRQALIQILGDFAGCRRSGSERICEIPLRTGDRVIGSDFISVK